MLIHKHSFVCLRKKESSYHYFICLNNSRNSSRVIFPSPSLSSFVMSFSTFSLLMLPPPSFLSSLGSMEPELSLSMACRGESWINVASSLSYFKGELCFIQGDFRFSSHWLASCLQLLRQLLDCWGLPRVVYELLPLHGAVSIWQLGAVVLIMKMFTVYFTFYYDLKPPGAAKWQFVSHFAVSISSCF